MGFGHYEDKDGSGNATTTAEELVTSNVGIDVGKKAHTDSLPPSHVTGVPAVDDPLACVGKPMDDADCYLSSEQRGLVFSDFQYQVGRTREAFNVACSQVEMQVLVEKDEGSGPLVAFIVNVLSGFLLSKLGSAVVDLKQSIKVDPFLAVASRANGTYVPTPSGVANAAKSAKASTGIVAANNAMRPSLKERAMLAVNKIDKGSLERKIENIIDKASEMPKKATQKSGERVIKTKAQESINYLEIVRACGERAFNELARHLPSGATDAELVAYDKLFDIDGKFTADFADAIRAKLERYMNSGIRRIGRSQSLRPLAQTQRGEITSAVTMNHDVRVQWRRYLSGAPKELVFVHQDFDGGLHDKSPVDATLGLDRLPKSKKAIAEELWGVAVARNVETWGAEPETVDIDDSGPDFADDPKRQLAAKNQKYKLAQAQATTERAANLALAQQREMDRQRYVRPSPLLEEPKNMFGGE